MKALLRLPAALLVLLLDTVEGITMTTISTVYSTRTVTSTSTATGSGYSFASSCNAASVSYDSYTSSWIKAHANVSTTTVFQGGPRVFDVTYYLNASTLCDGHPRVTYSPPIPLYTKATTTTAPITATSVQTGTYWYGSPPAPSPACSVQPKDCDLVWQDYTKSLKEYQAQTITASPPHTPFCANVSAAAQYSSAESIIRGCGDCTIYGDGVELLFFPPPATVSRDMCATTQSGTLTHYGTDDVITAYHGKSEGCSSPNTNGAEVVEYDGHAFTSGTAYISISSVWAVDRCSKGVGSTLYDAVLAMKSADVLSLRYSQDHFQALMSTDQQTGYPVSYADFRKPIPFSAWIGQTRCDGPWDDYKCGVIDENNFRPQLAIPPGIKKLDPRWSTCQMYFRGLYDPPVALQRVSSIAQITPPGGETIPAPTTAPQTTQSQTNNGLTTPAQPAPTYGQVTPTKQADSEPTASTPTSPSMNPGGNARPSISQPASGSSGQSSRQRRIRTKTIEINWRNSSPSAPRTAGQPITVLENHIITITVIQQSEQAPVTVECQDLTLSTVLPVDGVCTLNIPASLGGQPSNQGPELVVIKATGDGVTVQYVGGDEDDTGSGINGSGNNNEPPGNGSSGNSNNSGSPGPDDNEQPKNSQTGSSGNGSNNSSGSSSSGSMQTQGSNTTPAGQITPTTQQGSGARDRSIWVHHSTAVLLSILYFAVF